MPEPSPVEPATIERMAVELIGVPLTPEDRDAVAGLVTALGADMAAMRQMDVGETEPVLIYTPE